MRRSAALLMMLLTLPCANPVSAAEDFTFTSVAPYALSDHSLVFDSRRHRWLAIGGHDESGDVDVVEVVLSSGAAPYASERIMTTSGTRPKSAGSSDPLLAVYDSTRDCVYVNGGSLRAGWDSTPDTSWVLHLGDGLRWSGLGPKDQGRPRFPASGWVLDRVHDRLILLGIDEPTATTSVWTLSLSDTSRWIEAVTSGPRPSQRQGMAFAVEPDGAHAVMFGGARFGAGTTMQDCWRLDLSDSLRWEPLIAEGPAPDFSGAVGLVPMAGTGEMLCVGPGFDRLGTIDSTWTFAPAEPAWHVRPQLVMPSLLMPYAAGWDPDRRRVVAWSDRTSQVTEYDPQSASWSVPVTSTPGFARELLPGSAVLDVRRDRLLIWHHGILWARTLAADSNWRAIPIAGSAPPVYAGITCALDTTSSRFFVVGAQQQSQPVRLDSLWSVTLGDAPVWTAHAIEHRGDLFVSYSPTTVWDALRARILLVGGHNYSDSALAHLIPRIGIPPVVSALLVGEHPSIAPIFWPDSVTGRTGAPRDRENIGAGIDPKRDRLYLFAGPVSTDLPPYSRTAMWSFDLASGRDLRQVASSALEWNYGYPRLAYDPTNDRMLAVSDAPRGNNPFDIAPTLFEVARTEGGDTLIAVPSAGPPSGLWTATFAYDPARACMWYWGGMNLRSLTWPLPALAETAPAVADAASGRASVRWTLAGGAPGAADVERNTGDAWQRLATVNFGANGIVSYDDLAVPSGARVGYRLALSGAGGVHHTNELWLGSATAERGGLRLLGVRPQPSSGPLTLELSLPIDANVTLDLYDLAGRRARSQSVALSAGRHVFTPSGLERVPPGLYLLRASALGSSSTRRVVILR
jgi:hypothetical protein